MFLYVIYIKSTGIYVDFIIAPDEDTALEIFRKKHKDYKSLSIFIETYTVDTGYKLSIIE